MPNMSRRNLVIQRVKLISWSIAVLLSIAATPVSKQPSPTASPKPRPVGDQYLISWKMTAHGHINAPTDKSNEFIFEATQFSASAGQAVVTFDINGYQLESRILKAYLTDELDMKTLPFRKRILCGPIAIWDHEHYSLKTLKPISGPNQLWMYDPPRKQKDGSWVIPRIFAGSWLAYLASNRERFTTVHLSQGWRDNYHYEGENRQLADVVTSGPIHTVCDDPRGPSDLKVEQATMFDIEGEANMKEPIKGFDLPDGFSVPSTGSAPDTFFKEWKYRVTEIECSGPGACKGLPVEVNWTITVRRLSKCSVSGEIPLNDNPVNPDIKDEDIEMGVEHGSDTIDPDDGVAALNIRVTCDTVPIKNAKVNVRINVQKSTGGHLHDESNRPVGSLNDTPVIGFSPESNSWWFTTDDDGRVHLTFKAGRADNDDRYGIAGIYKITATPDPARFPGRKAEVVVEAKVDGLSHVDADPNYVNDVCSGAHRSGDNATAATKRQLVQFAKAFHDAQARHNDELAACGVARWDVYPLWVIDVSLPFGGLDDLGPAGDGLFWSTPHQTHGRGDGVDFSVHDRIQSGKVCEQNKSAKAWPPDGFKAPICGGYKIAPQGWLMMKMFELGGGLTFETGSTYGHWDKSDFYAPSQPWHLHFNQ
jgi:hypothetical protein